MTGHPAITQQRRAAVPGQSAWVTANAGSGKTKVLTDRVTRLLLDDASPERILCLTYTTAAASEIQTRILTQLSDWASLPDDKLAGRIRSLGVEAVGPGDVARARRLFAKAVDTPGGLRIQTIHAFCASVLRRFPLEAGVSPGFVELDDIASEDLRLRVAEDIAAGPGQKAFDSVARYLTGEDSLSRFLDEICSSASLLEGKDVTDEAFGITAELTEAEVCASLDDPDTTDLIGRLGSALCEAGGSMNTGTGRLLLEAQGVLGAGRLQLLARAFLTTSGKDGLRRKSRVMTGGFLAGPGKPMANAINDLTGRVEQAAIRHAAIEARDKTRALTAFAAQFLPAYSAAKTGLGALDFDDLVRATSRLLSDRSVADWVLYQLDGGIDHILVDEAQDTSPLQWSIIERIAEDFFAGEGVAGRQRTLFVVGDPKQSIFSFQGADVAVFEDLRRRFRERIEGAAQAFPAIELLHSFRSSPAILRTIDQTFRDPDNCGWSGPTTHLPFHEDAPGRVDLWEAIPSAQKPQAVGLSQDDHIPVQDHSSRRLAEAIARELRRLIDAGTIIPTRDGPRPMHEGDVMILVQRRQSGPFHDIIRACKAAGLTVAGADRLRFAGEIAVRDLTAMLSFLSLETDDLALATVLRSPLGGLSESELYDLAATRPEGATLWSALLASGTRHAPVLSVLHDLRACTDFLRPYDLLERVLTRHGGRQRLLDRLGAEAVDGIDAVLDRAIAYEATEVPTLDGFLAGLGEPDIEIKRQPDQNRQALRVMTVHAAKGLEAPVVILPDTTAAPSRRKADSTVRTSDGRVLWRVNKAAAPDLQRQAEREDARRHLAERRRLLYVAMSRAESWLIVCGSGNPEKDSWHELVRQGLEAAGAGVLDPPEGITAAWRHSWGEWPEVAKVPGPAAEERPPSLPDWIGRPPPEPVPVRRIVSPSALGGEKALPATAEAEGDTEAALEFGSALHRCIESVLSLPEGSREAAITSVVASVGSTMPEAARAVLTRHLAAVVASPAIAALIANGALLEAGLCGPLAPDGAPFAAGAADLLHVAPDRVLVVDFKSNAAVPSRPDDVPGGILRQMGGYDAILSQVYPGRRVETAIFWTATGDFMPLPRDIVRAALQNATMP